MWQAGGQHQALGWWDKLLRPELPQKPGAAADEAHYLKGRGSLRTHLGQASPRGPISALTGRRDAGTQLRPGAVRPADLHLHQMRAVACAGLLSNSRALFEVSQYEAGARLVLFVRRDPCLTPRAPSSSRRQSWASCFGAAAATFRPIRSPTQIGEARHRWGRSKSPYPFMKNDPSCHPGDGLEVVARRLRRGCDARPDRTPRAPDLSETDQATHGRQRQARPVGGGPGKPDPDPRTSGAPPVHPVPPASRSPGSRPKV